MNLNSYESSKNETLPKRKSSWVGFIVFLFLGIFFISYLPPIGIIDSVDAEPIKYLTLTLNISIISIFLISLSLANPFLELSIEPFGKSNKNLARRFLYGCLLVSFVYSCFTMIYFKDGKESSAFGAIICLFIGPAGGLFRSILSDRNLGVNLWELLQGFFYGFAAVFLSIPGIIVVIIVGGILGFHGELNDLIFLQNTPYFYLPILGIIGYKVGSHFDKFLGIQLETIHKKREKKLLIIEEKKRQREKQLRIKEDERHRKNEQKEREEKLKQSVFDDINEVLGK